MKDLNTNQKIAIAAIVAAVLVAAFFWYNSPFNKCVRYYADTEEDFVKKYGKDDEGWAVKRCIDKMAGN